MHVFDYDNNFCLEFEFCGQQESFQDKAKNQIQIVSEDHFQIYNE